MDVERLPDRAEHHPERAHDEQPNRHLLRQRPEEENTAREEDDVADDPDRQMNGRKRTDEFLYRHEPSSRP